jgi:hypothetical protein
VNLQPRHFLDLLERERRWCELLISGMLTRAELRKINVKLHAPILSPAPSKTVPARCATNA